MAPVHSMGFRSRAHFVPLTVTQDTGDAGNSRPSRAVRRSGPSAENVIIRRRIGVGASSNKLTHRSGPTGLDMFCTDVVLVADGHDLRVSQLR